MKTKAWEGTAQDGITPTQGEVLSHLGDAPLGLKLGELAAKLGVSAPTASDTVTALVQRGLVQKTQGTDRRSVVLMLTRDGARQALRMEDRTAFLSKAIETLDLSDQAQFLQSLVHIIKVLQDNGDIVPQRICLTCAHFRPYVHKDAATPHHCAFIDTAFGAPDLRINCADHLAAP
jgi:DNA-binding MarR family transcriptional regulator